MKHKWRFTEDTSLSIGLVIGLIGGILWLSHIAFLSESNAAAIDEVQKKQDSYASDIIDIKADLKYIRQRVDAP